MAQPLVKAQQHLHSRLGSACPVYSICQAVLLLPICCLVATPSSSRSGDGGSGEIVEAGRGKYVKNNKYHPGGNQPKQLWLPASEWLQLPPALYRSPRAEMVANGGTSTCPIGSHLVRIWLLAYAVTCDGSQLQQQQHWCSSCGQQVLLQPRLVSSACNRCMQSATIPAAECVVSLSMHRWCLTHTRASSWRCGSMHCCCNHVLQPCPTIASCRRPC